MGSEHYSPREETKMIIDAHVHIFDKILGKLKMAMQQMVYGVRLSAAMI